MRTLRLYMVATAIVALLGGLSVAVVAQTPDGSDTAGSSEPAGSVTVRIENRPPMDGTVIAILLEGVPRRAGGDTPTRLVGSFVVTLTRDDEEVTDIIRAAPPRVVSSDSPIAVVPPGIHTVWVLQVPGELEWAKGGSVWIPRNRYDECNVHLTVAEAQPGRVWVRQFAGYTCDGLCFVPPCHVW